MAVIAIPVFQRLRLGSVLGYLAAGAIVGPWGFGFIDQVEEIRYIAEFGVVFLLFIIGIELKPARLWDMRRMVFGLGTAQVMVTGLVLAGLALLLLGGIVFVRRTRKVSSHRERRTAMCAKKIMLTMGMCVLFMAGLSYGGLTDGGWVEFSSISKSVSSTFGL